jgi:hypothetical protein
VKDIAIPIRINRNETVFIYADNIGSKGIYKYLDGPKKRRIEFYEITEIIFEGLSNIEKYRKIPISQKHQHYFIMIFEQPWNRACILCKEKKIDKTRHIVLIKLYKGSFDQIQEQVKKDIEEKGGYSYDLK